MKVVEYISQKSRDAIGNNFKMKKDQFGKKEFWQRTKNGISHLSIKLLEYSWAARKDRYLCVIRKNIPNQITEKQILKNWQNWLRQDMFKKFREPEQMQNLSKFPKAS